MDIAVPDPPVSVTVRCNSINREAEIWWQPGKENYAPILNFVVQYNTTFQPDLWYNIATNISQNNRRIVVTMSPWGNYTFRVMSRNKIGYSLPSFPSVSTCRTQARVPDKNPQNVIGEGDRPGNLVIFWTVSYSVMYLFFGYVISGVTLSVDVIDGMSVIQYLTGCQICHVNKSLCAVCEDGQEWCSALGLCCELFTMVWHGTCCI